MAASRGNFGELLEPGLRKIYGLAYDQFPEQYSKVFEIKTSGKKEEHSLTMSGFGAVPEKPEGQSVAFNDAIQGIKTTLTSKTYGLGFIVTSEMHDDDQYGKINKLPRALSRSIRHTIETNGANIFNRAFSNSYLGGDGKEMCSLLHPRLDGGVLANEPSVGADLSMTSFEQALIDIAAFKDDKGLLINAKPKMLVVPQALDYTASQILKSTKDPESANNASNPAMGRIPYMVWNFLTDPKAWFILTDVPGLVYYWRKRPKFTRDNDFDTENAKFKSIYRSIEGWEDPRNVYGSPGA